ncbi:MAG: nuclear transport factor 2 family protein [Firmicutes bacterium]|jgi:ketosteroid isomerase-like protein|nr:nuclear transport factor 2 family protein [Bacillota bacterium]
MKLKSFLAAALVLSMAVFLSGCLGGGSAASEEDVVHRLLNTYEQAFRTKNADKLAALYVYPIEIDGAHFESAAEAAAYYELSFVFLTEVHEFELINRRLIITGNEATAEVDARSKITMLGVTLEDEVPGTLMLRKIGNQWKISGHQTVE